MNGSIPVLLENNFGFALCAGFVALIGFSMKVLKGAFDFHYEYFTRRKLRRMTDLLPQVDEGSLLHGFISQAISVEIFRIASGLKIIKIDAAAIMHLCKFRKVPPDRVKYFARNIIRTPSGHVIISISTLEKVAAYYSVTAATVIFIFGIHTFITSFFMSFQYSWVAGSLLLLICSIATRFFLKDWRHFEEIKNIQRDLLSNPLPICEEL